MLGSTYQTTMSNLWLTSANGQISLTDGQVVYVVEMLLPDAPTLNLGPFTSKGVYARYFF